MDATLTEMADMLNKSGIGNTVVICGAEASIVDEVHHAWALHVIYDHCDSQEQQN